MEKLAERARDASRRAYMPYSRFAVGAAVESATGRQFSGCNVENASFGLTICAERNAVFQMVAAGERELVRVVIYTPTPEPTSPCGACRQVLFEFGPDAEVVSVCDGEGELRTTVRELLPRGFGPADLA